jgi:hypothetical protein
MSAIGLKRYKADIIEDFQYLTRYNASLKSRGQMRRREFITLLGGAIP